MVASGDGWDGISVGRESYQGLVYSMDVQGNHTYVADNIVTHNSQDLSKVMLDIARRQDAQVIALGDDQQAIYAWRGAINAMQELNGDMLPLTESWRFGSEIADMANFILEILGEDWLVTGKGSPGLVTDDPFDLRGEAVLCRSNAGVIRETLELLDENKSVGVVGGTREAVQLLYACWDLYCDKKPRHPEIGMFRNWQELVIFSESEEGGGFKPVVGMVERYRASIKSLCYRLKNETVPEQEAEFVVSTAHKAKGREWDSVRIGQDFSPLAEEEQPERISANGEIIPGVFKLNEEEANLQYVTVTRAKGHLNMAGLGRQLEADRSRLGKRKKAPVQKDEPENLIDILDAEEEW